MDGVEIADTHALVTGAGRGLGRALVQELLDRGAARVYAAARGPEAMEADDERVVPIRVDVTEPRDVEAAALRCIDVAVVINNAGAMLRAPLLGAPDLNAARREMETNYFGTLAMCRAFAPVLARHGGGALVNILSVASWIAPPFNGSYCASKSAEWALTNAVRVELRSQSTLVVGVHCDWIDTDMAADVSAPKVSPRDVAAQVVAAVGRGDEEVLADDPARRIRALLSGSYEPLYADFQRQWDAGQAPWGA